MANLLSTTVTGTVNTTGRVVVGGNFSNNAYSSVASTRLHFGGGDSDANDNYYIGTNLSNYGGNYTKLDLRWHTGIRMGARPEYGGIRFFNNETLASRIMSIGETDANVRIDNNLYIGGAGGWITDLLNAKYSTSGGTLSGSLSFADVADNIRFQKGSNHLNLKDPWSNFHLYIPSGGIYSDATSYYFRNTSSTIWLSIESGNVQASSSLRAPIFYDSENTGYYLDPASRSNLNMLTLSGAGHFYPNTWIEFGGYYGLYSPNNNAHFRPNNANYGSWLVTGTRNGWRGIEFESGDNGNVNLMISNSSTVSGFHNNSYGWQFRWDSGTLYCHKGTYGGGTAATVLDSSNYSSWAQPASTAINTSNIGSQSVNYANSAGSANAVTWGNVSGKPSLDYQQEYTFTAPPSPDGSGYVWVRISMGGFNSGGDFVRFSISRAIFWNSSSPYGGPSMDVVAYSREWHGGQEGTVITYAEHGSVPGSGWVTNAGPRDLAGGGYWFYMRIWAGVDYAMRVYRGSGQIGTAWEETTDPTRVYAIRTGVNNVGDVHVGLNTNGDVYGSRFYDYNDTAYYGDFHSRSVLNSLQLGNAASDTSNLKLDVQGHMAIRGSNGLFFGVSSNNFNSWTTKIYASGSTQYFNAQSFIFDNQGYGGTTFVTINGAGIYNNFWYRNYGEQGMYNQSYGTHFYSNSGDGFVVTGSGGVVQLQFRSNHQSTLRGYVYADTSNNIGFLNNGGGWNFRTASDKNAFVHGQTLTINADNAGWSSIFMNDGDEGAREIHCNSNRIGFLTQAGSWGSWCGDDGSWSSDTAIYAPIFYDSQNSGFYLDPNNTGTSLNIAGGIVTTASGGSVLLKHAVSEVDAWIFQENAANWGLYWKNNPSGNHTFGGYTTVGAELFGMSAANISGNGVLTTNFVGATSAYAQWMMSNYTGYIWSASTIFAAGDMRAPIFYDSNDTGYYGNFAGFSRMSEIGVTNNYVYNYDSVESSRSVAEFGNVGKYVATRNAVGDYPSFSFEHVYGSHSWGQIARFHIRAAAADRPSIQFSSGSSNDRWNIGFCTGTDNNFRITQNMGYRPDGSGVTDGWGTPRFVINNVGSVGIGTQGPGAKLDVVSGDASLLILQNTENNFGANQQRIDFYGKWYHGLPDSIIRHGAIAGEHGDSSGYQRGNLKFYTNWDAGTIDAMTIRYDGNVGIGNANPIVRLDVAGNSRISGYVLVNNHSDNTLGYRILNTSNSAVSAMFTNSSNQLVIAAGAVDQINLNKKVYVNGVALGVNVTPSSTAGRIDASNDIVAYSSSDERLKHNITPIENAIDKVKSLTGVEFDWKPEYKHAHGYEGHDTGIIAQQVQEVIPSAVRTNDTGFLAVRYEKLIGLLIEGMKEQQTQIDELKTKLDGLTK